MITKKSKFEMPFSKLTLPAIQAHFAIKKQVNLQLR